jgi:glycosyltransferase involved in cell wall biosynthesis
MDKQQNQEKLVSVIIPAFNEEKNIGGILRIAATHPLVGEVIVVDDGSDDGTAQVASQYTDLVMRLESNHGKAYAMDRGVAQAKYEVITFLDADLINYDHEKLSKIIMPVLNKDYEMFAGLRDKKLYWLNKLARISPILTGERTLTKKLWYTIPDHYKKNFQIEIAMNFYAKIMPRNMGFVLQNGVSQYKKEQKYGFWKGQYRRVGMMKDLFLVGSKVYVWEMLKLHLHTRNHTHHDSIKKLSIF